MQKPGGCIDIIYLTPTAKVIYDAIYAETARGTMEFVGHLKVGRIDHGQMSREIRRLVSLGVITSESIHPSSPGCGRRMRILVKPGMIEIAGRRRTEPHPPPVEPDPEPVEDHRDRELARFEVAWQEAFPRGADYRRGNYEPHQIEDVMRPEVGLNFISAPTTGARA